MNILVIIGIIFSLVAFAVSLTLVSIAIFSEDMKYKKRKKYLQNAVFVIMNGVGYWVIIGGMYACCWLKLALDQIIP